MSRLKIKCTKLGRALVSPPAARATGAERQEAAARKLALKECLSIPTVVDLKGEEGEGEERKWEMLDLLHGWQPAQQGYDRTHWALWTAEMLAVAGEEGQPNE